MLSTGHIWLLAILLIVVLIVWGPGKLPDVGAGLGRAINEFRNASTKTREEFTRATSVDGTPVTPAAAAPVAVPVTPTPPTPAAPAPEGAVAPPAPVPAPIGAGPEVASSGTDPAAPEGVHQSPS